MEKYLSLENFENNDQIHEFKIFEKFITVKFGLFGQNKIIKNIVKFEEENVMQNFIVK